MRFVMDKELVFFKGWIFQTLNTGIDNCPDNQNLCNKNKPKHHDYHDNGTEKSDINQMIDITIDINRKDIQ